MGELEFIWYSLNQKETRLFFEDTIICVLTLSLLQALPYYARLLYCLFTVLVTL